MRALCHHTLLEYYNCDVKQLRRARTVKTLLCAAVLKGGGKIVKTVFHNFSPYGVSGVVVITESHVTIHSWPEHGYAALDLFMCGNADPRQALPVLERIFRPKEILVEEMLRGTACQRKAAMPAYAQGNSRKTMQHIYEKIWIGELWNSGNPAGARVLAEDFIDHRPIEQFPGNRNGHIAMALDWHRAFPDMQFKIQDVIVEGDKLVARYSAKGTHLGPFSGHTPTGRNVSLTGIDIFRFRDGYLLEWWHNEDIYGLMKQIAD